MKPITVVTKDRPTAEGQLRGMESKGAKDCKLRQLTDGTWEVTCYAPPKPKIWVPTKR